MHRPRPTGAVPSNGRCSMRALGVRYKKNILHRINWLVMRIGTKHPRPVSSSGDHVAEQEAGRGTGAVRVDRAARERASAGRQQHREDACRAGLGSGGVPAGLASAPHHGSSASARVDGPRNSLGRMIATLRTGLRPPPETALEEVGWIGDGELVGVRHRSLDCVRMGREAGEMRAQWGEAGRCSILHDASLPAPDQRARPRTVRPAHQPAAPSARHAGGAVSRALRPPRGSAGRGRGVGPVRVAPRGRGAWS